MALDSGYWETADTVEVTRCKDCCHARYVTGFMGTVLYCLYWDKDTEADGYCHEGG